MESPNSEQEHSRQANDSSQIQVLGETTQQSLALSRTKRPTSNPPSRSASLKQPQEILAQKRQSLVLLGDLEGAGTLSLGATDRVFPIKSVVSVDPTSTLAPQTLASASEAHKQPRASSITEGSCTRGQPSQGTHKV